jgi:hypothetical protein
MAQAQGWKGTLGIQKETTFGADPAAPSLNKVYFETANLNASRGLTTSNTISGTRNPTKPELGNIDVTGDISVEAQAYIGSLLEGVMGAVATTGAATPYTHVFTVGAALPSYVIEQGFTDIAQFFKYNGCKFSKMSINTTPEGFQKMSFGVIGKKETIGVASFDATATDLGKTSFTGFMAAVLEGGGAISNVSKLDINIENNLDGSVYVIGGAGTRGAIPEGMVKVSGSIDVLFENVSLLTKAISGTESSLKITYTLGTGAGTVGNELLEILVPELIYSQKSPGITGPGGIMVSLSFEGYYSNSVETSALQITIKNSQAAIV